MDVGDHVARTDEMNIVRPQPVCGRDLLNRQHGRGKYRAPCVPKRRPPARPGQTVDPIHATKRCVISLIG